MELAAAATGSGDTALAATARQGALKYYDLLVSQYPDAAQSDEALYFAALEHERHGDEAWRVLDLQLIAKHSQSKYVPYAYFAFGEGFARQSVADPAKIDLGLQAFRKVVGFPPPTNKLYGWAWVRIGNLDDARGNAAEAQAAYAKAKEYAATYGDDVSGGLPGAPAR